MYDAFSAVSGTLENLIARSLNIAYSDSVICSLGAYEAASPVALRYSLDPHDSLARVVLENERECALLSGVPLVAKTALSGGHICFSLTNEAYGAIMRHIIEEAPLPPAMEVTGDASYAYMRARMLSGKGGDALPPDESVRRALWQCMGLCEAGLSAHESAARLAAASASVLSIGRELSLQSRHSLMESCGGFGACTARLLYYAISNFGG